MAAASFAYRGQDEVNFSGVSVAKDLSQSKTTELRGSIIQVEFHEEEPAKVVKLFELNGASYPIQEEVAEVELLMDGGSEGCRGRGGRRLARTCRACLPPPPPPSRCSTSSLWAQLWRRISSSRVAHFPPDLRLSSQNAPSTPSMSTCRAPYSSLPALACVGGPAGRKEELVDEGREEEVDCDVVVGV